jgi:putative oxidoreductase
MSTPTMNAAPSARRRVAEALAPSSIDALRLSLGLVFLVFGALKFVPGLSPAEDLVVRTVDALSLGLMPERLGMVAVAALETFIGLALITKRLLILGLAALVGAAAGFFAPLFLFADELFAGGPALEVQYIVKDIVLVAAAGADFDLKAWHTRALDLGPIGLDNLAAVLRA